MTIVHLDLPVQLYRLISIKAKKLDMSRSALIRSFLRRVLK